ncbi:MAG: antibiotic biosynthesis monooxygenase family protein [Alphaproteobacteria bacterium]
MILEHAILNVKPGQEAAFEAAMADARPLIAASEGFGGIEVRPCLEQPGQYLLLVWWDTVDDHEIGFRGSDRYQRWRALLHDFYDPFPVVQHYSPSIIG